MILGRRTAIESPAFDCLPLREDHKRVKTYPRSQFLHEEVLAAAKGKAIRLPFIPKLPEVESTGPERFLAARLD